ncbi:hypothetical protein AAZX31_06G246300 [Glycine max]
MASNTIIQYSSSSSHSIITTYDVFVSFCGEDTRNNFTAFLFDALSQNCINAFKDDADLKKGESIAPELLQAIEGSRLFVVVFSKNYASSTWCLRELAHICNCTIEASSSRVLPIFYDVDPSEVRKQSGYYGIAFEEHEGRFREDIEKMEEVLRWREALTQVANLSGWDIRNKSQPAMIKEIVQNIKYILGPKFQNPPNGNLVGMESSVEELEKCLVLESVSDVRVVGISGMGGIGKTTLARALYEKIADQYDFHCFVDDVNNIYRHSSSLGVQKQLLSQCLNDENLEICNVSKGTYLVSTMLRNKRGLIVLDNVGQVEQLHMFTRSRETLLRECLGGGSRIIITSRDEHILRTHGVNHVYQVQPLSWDNAVKLFCINAFKCTYIMSDYEMLTHGVLSHAQGHPLAIEVIGKSLFGRNVSQWTSTLDRLRDNKSRNIMDVLRISYDDLEEKDREIFLDIACFFNDDHEQHVKEILNFRGFDPEIGLPILVEKSLITISDGLIHMHDLLRDLGKCIVREKSPKEPRKWSRLWDFEDIYKEAKNLEAIVVKYISWRVLGTTMRVDALSKMRNLKLLMFPIAWTFSGNLNYLSNELGYLYWKRYPFNLLPPCFQPHKLVELNFCGSKIKQLWEGRKPLPNLRLLDVSNCKNLIEVPNFGEAPNLASLNLCGCIRLRQLHSSIGLLRKLTILNLKECRSLTDLPHFVQGLNLEELNLEGCVQLRQIHPSIGHLRKLTVLNLKDCISLVSIPNTILGLNSLECPSLSGCSKLYNIHLSEELRDARYLKKLRMGEAPSCSQSIFSFLKKWLPWPSMAFDKSLEDAHKDSVRCLLPSLPILSCMRELDLSFCNLLKIPDAFGNLHCLEKLCLRGNNFETLPSLKELSKLLHLNLQHCKRLKYLPELPSRTDVPSPSSNKLRWTSVENEEIVLGLNIFNCPELVERDCCTSMCLSWMMQMVQAFSKPKSPWWIPFISSIIPGSKIPRWFDEQHLGMGNVIKIEHASDHFMQHHNNWIGIACSVIFVPHKERTMRHPESFTDESDERPCFYIPLLFRKDLVTDESDHMMLFYYTRESFTFLTSFEHRDELKVVCASSDPDQYFDVEVKKYGYRRVYRHDLELSNLTTMHRKNLLPRKRKFLAIEENK